MTDMREEEVMCKHVPRLPLQEEENGQTRMEEEEEEVHVSHRF